MSFSSRAGLRARLLADRAIFAKGDSALAAARSVNDHMIEVLDALEPHCLGAYWAVRGEFDLQPALARVLGMPHAALALAFAVSRPLSPEAPEGAAVLRYHAWDGRPPSGRDACGIPSSEGPAVEPDVVLVPCVGYTASGYRLGYGGGYFDRWLAAHPQVTAVGVAWAGTEVSASEFDAQPHDIPLALVVTERGVVS